MSRVKKSTLILHKINDETKADTWDGLIFAAETELRRIGERSAYLTKAIKVFRKKKLAGAPVAQLSNHPQQQQHNV
jgi:hypothetical protein